MSRLPLLALTVTLAAMASGCQTTSTPTPEADNRIRILRTTGGETIALPPDCVPWQEGWGDPWENKNWPRFGCAQARNLAAQVARADDLVEGRPLGPAEAVAASGAITRYQAGKTTPLIDPHEEAPKEILKMDDKRVGGPPKQ